MMLCPWGRDRATSDLCWCGYELGWLTRSFPVGTNRGRPRSLTPFSPRRPAFFLSPRQKLRPSLSRNHLMHCAVHTRGFSRRAGTIGSEFPADTGGDIRNDVPWG